MAEDAVFLPLVRGACTARGLGCYHTGVSIGSDEGFPDLTIWGPGGLILRELKGSTGRLAVVQLDRIQALRAAGVDAGLWWPEDWHLGIVQRELDALTRPRSGVVALPPLAAGLGASTTPTPRPAARDTTRARCGCPIVDGRILEHTCPVWGGTGNPWKAGR